MGDVLVDTRYKLSGTFRLDSNASYTGYTYKHIIKTFPVGYRTLSIMGISAMVLCFIAVLGLVVAHP